MSNSTILPTDPKERREAKRGLWLLAGLAAAVTIGVASWTGDESAAPTSAQTSTPVSSMIGEKLPASWEPGTMHHYLEPAPVALPEPPAAPPPAPVGPATSFGTGTHVVGTDIVPGTYKANPSSTCYWARLSSTADEGDIIANHYADGPTTVTIKKGDAAFVSQRCGQWTKVSK